MRWEYRFLTVPMVRQKTKDEALQTLNDWGEEGWEAVGISGDINGGMILLKRPVT